jgi:hypothetical protein
MVHFVTTRLDIWLHNLLLYKDSSRYRNYAKYELLREEIKNHDPVEIDSLEGRKLCDYSGSPGGICAKGEGQRSAGGIIRPGNMV